MREVAHQNLSTFLLAGNMVTYKSDVIVSFGLTAAASVAYYVISAYIGAPDSIFLALVLFASLVSAIFFSPERKILLGIKAIKSYDGIAALGFSGIITAMTSPDSLIVAAMLFLVFFVFAVSCVIRMRR